MILMSSGSLLELPERIRDNVRTDTFKLTADANVQVGDLNAFIERQEKAYLIYCYEKCGTTRKMAEELNVNHSTIMKIASQNANDWYDATMLCSAVPSPLSGFDMQEKEPAGRDI